MCPHAACADASVSDHAGQQGDSCLLVGTSSGWLQLHAPTGTLLHRQQLHSLPVLKLQVRCHTVYVFMMPTISSVMLLLLLLLLTCCPRALVTLLLKPAIPGKHHLA